MVCGLGDVGYRIVNLLLDLGEEVVVVSLAGREEWIRALKSRGVEVHCGDARDEDFLVECGLAEVDAVIACLHNDGANVEIALDVKRLYPEKRTIARIVDPQLAQHAEKHLGVHRAISMATAAAPMFAAATYGDEVVAEFMVREERFLCFQVAGPQHLREKPLIVIKPTGECLRHESKDLAEGETAVVIARAETMAEQVPKHHPKHHSLLKALNPVALIQFLRGVWNHATVQLRAVLIVIVSVILLSVIVYWRFMGLTPVESFYFVVTTATTTGYGDYNAQNAASWLKIYTCFMMIVSVAGSAVLFSIMTDYILTARLMALVGRHHIPDHGHIVVVGVGNEGHRIVDELTRLKAPVVAIDRAEDGEFLSTLRAKVHVIIGDGRDVDTLIRAGVHRAKALIAVTQNDAVNLGVGLTARELNPSIRVVVSIMDGEFAAKIRTIAEIDASLSPPSLAAPAFVGFALYDNAVASFQLGNHLFTLVEAAGGDVHQGGQRLALMTRDLAPPAL